MMQDTDRKQIIVYYADISFLTGEEVFHDGMACVSKERQDAILRMKNPADQRRSLGAGLLLEYGLRTQGYSLREGVSGSICVHLKRGAYGKPYIAELPDCCFNLSHAGDYVAAAFADCMVGIDIERVRDVRSGLANRFFTAEECAFLQRDQKDDLFELEERQKQEFLWLWTRKESYIKAVGEGMHLPLNAFSVLDDIVCREHNYYLHTCEPVTGYQLSVCATAPMNVRMTEIDLAKSI